MKKLFLPLVVFAGFYLNSSADKIRFSSAAEIGQVYTEDAATGEANVNISFDSSKGLSTVDAATTPPTLTVVGGATNNGIQVISGTWDGATFGRVDPVASSMRARDYRRGTLGRFTDVADFMTKVAAAELSLDKPAALMLGDDAADGKLAQWTGMYKRSQIGFQLDFTGMTVVSDITLDISTLFEGSTGATGATYTLSVYADGTPTNNTIVAGGGSLVGSNSNFYVTGTVEQTNVGIFASAGLNYADFSNRQVYFFIETEGVGTETTGVYQPVIGIDNVDYNVALPSWIEPAAGITANAVVENSASPLLGTENTTVRTSVNLKTTGRLGAFVITNDNDVAGKRFSFLSTGAIFANDGAGNYDVPVDYDFVASDLATNTKASMTIAAPTSAADDDIMILFDVAMTPVAAGVVSNRLELDCGVRIFYDYSIQGTTATQVKDVAIAGVNVTASNGTIYVTGATSTVIVTNISGQVVKTVSADAAVNGVSVGTGIYIVSTEAGNAKIVVE